MIAGAEYSLANIKLSAKTKSGQSRSRDEVNRTNQVRQRRNPKTGCFPCRRRLRLRKQ